MQKILLSIIIPCRNGAKWIPQIAESIHKSDFNESEYEVILVDDASEDETLVAMNEAASKYTNVRVKHLDKCLCLGGGRNKGLEAAKGEYVWFVDADDLIAEHGCDEALHKAVQEQLDVLGFEYSVVDYEGKMIKETQTFSDYTTKDGIAFAKHSFLGPLSGQMGFVWRFLYRRAYLLKKKMLFSEGVRWEDTVFMPQAIIEAERVGAVPTILYKYRQNPHSISGTMHRVYPAKMIYEYAFVAGKELLDYSLTVQDEQLRADLYRTAIHKYINGSLLYLLRTSHHERKAFYRILRDNKEFVSDISRYFNTKNRFLLTSCLGHITIDFLSIGYKFKHRK